MECIFVCDVGTSSLKSALVDCLGQVYKIEYFSFSTNPTADKWYEALLEAFEHLNGYAKNKAINIVGICISGNGPSLVSVFKDSKTQDKLFLWNEAVPNFNLSSTEKFIIQKIKDSGSIFLPRIFSFAKKYPFEFKNSRYLFSCPEYLAFRLTGTPVTFLPTQQYINAYWNAEILQELEILDKKNPFTGNSLLNILPTFVKTGDIIGTYKGLPVIAGAPDFFVALLGTKTITPFTACSRAGSSEGLNVCLEKKPKKLNPKIRLLPSALEPYCNISLLLGQTGETVKKAVPFIKSLPTDFSVKRLKTNSEAKPLIELCLKIKKAIEILEKEAGKKLQFTLTGGQYENINFCKLKAIITKRTFRFTQTTASELLGDGILGFTSLGYYSNWKTAAEKMVRFVGEITGD